MYPISRSTRPLDSKPASPRKAPESKTDGKEKGSSSADGTPGMKDNEAPLAGYLMARAAMHRKVEGQDLKNLRAGSETVREVQDRLPLGRSNVHQDIENAKDANIPVRNFATRKLIKTLMFEKSYFDDVTQIDMFRSGAATSQFAKTGTCGNFAAINTPLHAAKLADLKDERAIVAQAKHDTIDHTWSEMIPRGIGADGKPILHGKDVIMDGWCQEKLAVFREDSEYARLGKDGSTNQTTHRDILDHKTGPAAWKTVEEYKTKIESNEFKRNVYHREFDRLVEAGAEMPKEHLWYSESVFHADFRELAGKALHPKAPSPGEGAGIQGANPDAKQQRTALMADIQAVGVARSLGANIQGAIGEAPAIIASAKDMFPEAR